MAKTNKAKIAKGVAAGLVAAGAVAAAGYYFYGSKDAKKHRDTAVKWANDMKEEVVRQAKGLKKIDANDLAEIVDTVAGTYSAVRSINAADLKRAANELKANWKMIQAEAQKTGRKDMSHAKAVGKKAVARGKKTVKKVARKAR